MAKREYRRYTDRDKAAALTQLRSGRGVLNETARELGIPYETLRGWAAGRHLSPEVMREFGVVRDQLSARIEDVIYEAIAALPGKFGAASLRDVGTVLAQLVDRIKLLWEEPGAGVIESVDTGTVRVESARSEAGEREFAERRKEVEELIRRAMEIVPGLTRRQVIETIRRVRPELVKFLE